MSIVPSDTEPISHKNYNNRPSAQESDDKAAASEDKEMPTLKLS
jgi:hypothetical protein